MTRQDYFGPSFFESQMSRYCLLLILGVFTVPTQSSPLPLPPQDSAFDVSLGSNTISPVSLASIAADLAIDIPSHSAQDWTTSPTIVESQKNYLEMHEIEIGAQRLLQEYQESAPVEDNRHSATNVEIAVVDDEGNLNSVPLVSFIGGIAPESELSSASKANNAEVAANTAGLPAAAADDASADAAAAAEEILSAQADAAKEAAGLAKAKADPSKATPSLPIEQPPPRERTPPKMKNGKATVIPPAPLPPDVPPPAPVPAPPRRKDPRIPVLWVPMSTDGKEEMVVGSEYPKENPRVYPAVKVVLEVEGDSATCCTDTKLADMRKALAAKMGVQEESLVIGAEKIIPPKPAVSQPPTSHEGTTADLIRMIQSAEEEQPKMSVKVQVVNLEGDAAEALRDTMSKMPVADFSAALGMPVLKPPKVIMLDQGHQPWNPCDVPGGCQAAFEGEYNKFRLSHADGNYPVGYMPTHATFDEIHNDV